MAIVYRGGSWEELNMQRQNQLMDLWGWSMLSGQGHYGYFAVEAANAGGTEHAVLDGSLTDTGSAHEQHP